MEPLVILVGFALIALAMLDLSLKCHQGRFDRDEPAARNSHSAIR
jgi:hypothetical protein